MLVMIFGACSLCIAHYVKVTNTLSYREEYPRAVKYILDHHYVDDFVDSFPTPGRAFEVAQQLRYIHKSAGCELRKSSSNSSEVIGVFQGTVDKHVSHIFATNLTSFKRKRSRIFIGNLGMIRSGLS